MASYKNTIKESLLSYPTLYKKEEDVLEHLFFVIGNGYEWKNGQLVDIDGKRGSMESRVKEIWDDRLQREHCSKIFKVDWPEGFYPKTVDDPIIQALWKAQDDFRKKCIEIGVRDGDTERSIYPISGYCKLYSVPKDVKPDWLAAAHKAYDLAKSGYWKTTQHDRDHLAKIKKLLPKL